MEIFLAWLLLAGVQLAVTMSPGPAFVMSTRTALVHGRMQSIYTALGLGLGVGAHVIFVMLGLSLIIAQSVILFSIVKYAGAAYLMYLGGKSLYGVWKSRHQKPEELKSANPLPENLQFKRKAPWHFVLTGFLTNLLNPKAVVFFTAVFTQFISPETSLEIMVLYILTCSVIEAGWFSILGLVLTNTTIKTQFMRFMHWIEGLCGGIMILLGLRLLFAKSS